jgi:carbon monoxide dehydrogenase subunit G
MELTGNVEIAAPRASLWTALNDPDVLARCIDGVETLQRTDQGFEGTMNAKVGPVRARFAGTVRLEDVAEGTSWRLVGEGKGGVAGFAKGSADIALTELGPAATRLDYVVKAQVGGKLAQLGARLIEGTAKSYAEHFFARLKAEVEGVSIAQQQAPDTAEPPAAAPPPAPGGGLSPLVWGSGIIAATLAFLWWQWN